MVYPEEHLADLKRSIPLMLAAMKRDGLPIESGLINVGKVDKELDVALFFAHWITEINEIIENLNIVLIDMRELSNNYVLLKGSPEKRYYLLVRTYFHEFYRFRESFNRVIKAAASRRYIQPDEVPRARKAFQYAFEDTIRIRNNLVHGTVFWKGDKHFDLTLLSSARERGFAMQSCQTGEIWDIGSVLQDVCEETADILRDEGKRMSKVIQAIVRELVDVIAKV
ncbi:hypothetical protein [Nitrosospira sp. Nsp13]|uniref:hypothetical protein n=1 Tax=Nitrosospira sp. Nsp13 TaxID=1855332 RepID=UPI0011130F8F|nr:hypothetical protein [Nitrosospira sp. Nsp13]